MIVKNFCVILFFFSFLMIVSCSDIKEDSDVLATVGSHSISLEEFNERYLDYLVLSGLEDNIFLRRSVLRNLVNEILLLHYDDNELIFSNQDYKEELEWNRKQVILSYLKDKEVYAKIAVTEEELREAFVKVNEKISARHLYAKTEEEAEKLYELLQIGVSFKELAPRVFTDSTLQNNGGFLGYFTWGDMDPVFEEKAYSLMIGEISKPVKTSYGYSIIKVEDKIKHPLLTESEFTQKKAQLENTLKIKKKIPYEKAYIEKVFDKESFHIDRAAIPYIFRSIFTDNYEIEKEGVFNNSAICVRYKDKEYSIFEIEKKIKDLPKFHRRKVDSESKLQKVIESIIIQEELLKVAYSKDYDEKDIVQNKIKEENLDTFLKYKKEEVLENSFIEDSLVRKYYQNNIEKFYLPKQLNLQEIIIENRFFADSLYRDIVNGADFGDLAKKHSLTKWSADNKGELGLSPLSKFGSLKDKFWNSNVGEVIGPYKIGGYYGVFKILEKVDRKPEKLELIWEEVELMAKRANEREIFTKYFEHFDSIVDIDIDEKLFESYSIH